MRSILVAVGFLLVIVTTLIYKLPAKFIYQQLPFPLHSDIQLNNISGSIWSGHIGIINTPQLTLKKLSWQLSAWALLFGDIDIQWYLDDAAVKLQGEAQLSGEQLRLMNIKGHIDLIELGQRLPVQVILLGGKIDLELSQVEFRRSQLVNMVGSIAWKPARLLSPSNIELGEFKADLSSKEGQLLARLSDTGGAVVLTGEFTLSSQGAYYYALAIGVRDTSVAGLLNGFNQLGPQDENGLVKLSGRGALF